MKVQEKKYISIAMSSCYPNKGERERFIKGVLHFHHPFSTHVHNLDQLVWFVISMDLLFDFAINVTQVHASISLPWAPHKLSLEVGWKEAMPWWGYIHSEWHERSYGEVKLWLIFAKVFSKPQSYSRKVEETDVDTIPLFNFPNIMVDTSKLTGKGEA